MYTKYVLLLQNNINYILNINFFESGIIYRYLNFGSR